MQISKTVARFVRDAALLLLLPSSSTFSRKVRKLNCTCKLPLLLIFLRHLVAVNVLKTFNPALLAKCLISHCGVFLFPPALWRVCYGWTHIFRIPNLPWGTDVYEICLALYMCSEVMASGWRWRGTGFYKPVEERCQENTGFSHRQKKNFYHVLKAVCCVLCVSDKQICLMILIYLSKWLYFIFNWFLYVLGLLVWMESCCSVWPQIVVFERQPCTISVSRYILFL